VARIYRRSQTWHARAQRGGVEHRTSLQTKDRAVAEKRFRKWLDQLDATAWGEKPARTYAEAEVKFINEHLTTLKPKAAIRYGSSLKHLSEHFGKMRLDQITSAELSSFETKRRSAGMSPSTVRRDLACLSSLMTSCEDWEWIDSNPIPAYLRRRSRRGLKEGAARTRYLSIMEEEALLAAATPAVRDAITLAIDTGLRREELYSMQWWQVDFVRGLITTTSNTKNGHARMVPLPARSQAILAALPRYDGNDYVLINPDTKERYWQQNKGFKAAVRRAGLTNLRFHDLRRTAGCRWVQRDHKSMAEVSILLGHSSIQVTEQRYAFLDSEQVASSISRTKVSTQAADD
jgi:integrase